MLVPVEWLKDYVRFDLTTEQLSNLLTMAGLEVEAVANSGAGDVLDIKVTPNRGDCLSIVGLAREIIAKLGSACEPTPLWNEFQKGFSKGENLDLAETLKLTSVTVEDPELCPRYAARIIKSVRVTPSPAKIRARLEAAGMRAISNLVDVTNYVLLELGQPLHAFDYDKLAENRIIVRQAKAGEKILTLDGNEREIAPPMLTIGDAKGPVAVAGVMGGGPTEVTDSTTTVLLETAHFNPLSIRRTRKQLGLNTESSYRFERFVDPELVITASYRACQLLEDWGGFDTVEGILDVHSKPYPARVIKLRMDRCDLLLGMKATPSEAVTYLTRLGMSCVKESDRVLAVTVPSYRQDIQREDDLIEEVGRIHGYEKIPEELPKGTTTQGKDSPENSFANRLRSILLRNGICEMVNHSLRAKSPLDPPNAEYVPLRNPMSPEISVLRPSILPGIIESLQRNIRRGVTDLCAFEIGHVFVPNSESWDEYLGLAWFLCGSANPLFWDMGRKNRDMDFFDNKAIADEMLEVLGINAEIEPADDIRFHPGRSAVYKVKGSIIGIIGELHPDLLSELDLPKRVQAAEFDFPLLMKLAKLGYNYKAVPKFPAVRRDIAIVVDDNILWADIQKAIVKSGGPQLDDVKLFDIYTGEHIAKGKRSMAIALTLRKADGTYTEEEISIIINLIVSSLQNEVNATLRS